MVITSDCSSTLDWPLQSNWSLPLVSLRVRSRDPFVAQDNSRPFYPAGSPKPQPRSQERLLHRKPVMDLSQLVGRILI